MTESIRTGVIPKFKGESLFLSNFYVYTFSWRGWEFASAEHAFQAAKAFHITDSTINDMTRYMDKVNNSSTPAQAKQTGRSVRIDTDTWDATKVTYMREIVHSKFSQVPGLAGQLINTGAMLLVEGNDWGDDFWGRCKKDGKMVGLNTLGTILMEERGYWLHSNFEDKKGS